MALARAHAARDRQKPDRVRRIKSQIEALERTSDLE